MKQFLTKLLLVTFLSFIVGLVQAQHRGKIHVNGDLDRFYPVVFKDGNWGNHVPTVLQIGRSDTHENELWRGSVIAKFTFHSIAYGHGSNLVEVDVYQFRWPNEYYPLIAAYKDATIESGDFDFVLWLRGNTSYTYNCDMAQAPRVYDNVQHQLPYIEPGNRVHNYRTTIDPTLNSRGKTMDGSIYLVGYNSSYIASGLGIGIVNPSDKLEVAGKIRAQEIKVEMTGWPDYVFKEDYDLMSLEEIQQYIKQNGHLPEIPKAADVEQDGVSLGKMNKLLLKKIEELTLHLIEKDKKERTLEQRLEILERILENYHITSQK